MLNLPTLADNQEKMELHGSMSSTLRHLRHLKKSYGDFQGLKSSLQHVYKWKNVNCTGLGTFLDKFQLLRAKSDLFDKMKQLLSLKCL